MKRQFLIIIFTAFATITFAQGTATDAQNFFNSGNFTSAATIYEQLLAKKTTDALSNYRLARCYYEMGNLSKAMPFFEIAKEKYPASYFYIGLYKRDNYYFKEAKTDFDNYLAVATDPVFIAKAKTLLRQTTLSAEMMTRIEDIALIDSTIVDKNEFLSAYNIAKDIGQISMNIEQNDTTTFDQITFTTERGDRRLLSQMTGGQSDIFSSYKLADEQWSDTVSISKEINTLYNENYPFLMSDGLTFYFASDGEGSIGGYDIFITRYNPSKIDFYTPENIGMPFNSPYNDYMMVIDDVSGVGYFASDRFQPEGKVVIYSFLFNNKKEIIRSDNSDDLIKYAQLKLARKADNINLKNLPDDESKTEKQSADIQFFINSTITYHSISEFKSEDAKNLFEQYDNERINIEKLKEKLASLRNEYALADALAKIDLAPQILELEENIPQREKSLLQMEQTIRLLENNTLIDK